MMVVRLSNLVWLRVKILKVVDGLEYLHEVLVIHVESTSAFCR